LTLTEKIKKKRERLELYYARESTMLNDGVKAYGMGTRSAQRYDTALSDIRAQIKTLEGEIEELERQQAGQSPRKAVAVLPRDW
jgi:hypothetical protein